MKKTTTRRALFLSFVSMFLCFTMLIGTTYAWFTDTVNSGVNTIVAGNLDVELEYWDGDSFEPVTENILLFKEDAKWEPGHTEIAYLKVSNVGDLALKYQLSANVFDEVIGKTKDNKDIKLSEHLVFKAVEYDVAEAGTFTRENAIAKAGDVKGLATYNSATTTLAPKGKTLDVNGATIDDVDYIALIVYMPTTVENEANHDGTNVPSIKLGVDLFATQVEAEEDSFGKDYDKEATVPVISDAYELPATGETAASDLTFNANGDKGAAVTVKKKMLNSLAGQAETMELAQAEPIIDKDAKKVTVPYMHFVDENGDEIDLTNNTEDITVKFNVGDAFAVGETVVVYHDDKAIASPVVDSDKNITYTTKHFCEIVVSLGDGKIDSVAELVAAIDAVEDGGTVTLADDVTSVDGILIADKNVTIDLNGKTITGTKGRDADNNRIHVIVNNGILTIKNGTVKSAGNDGGSAIYNNAGATLTIEDVTLYGAPQSDPVYEAGVTKPFPSYAVNNYGNVVVNGATVKSYHGAIATGGNGVTVINDADIDVGLGQSTGITSYAIYSYENAQVTVNSGKFAFTKQEIYVNGGNTFCELGTNPIIINGGNYIGTSFSTGAGREYVIKGGTFDKDPTAYVANGYLATKNADGTYTVVKCATVANVADLTNAIANGGNIVLTEDIAITNTLMTTKDVVIDLNGNTMTAPSSGAVFQSQSNASPAIKITSSVPGAAINVLGGDTAVLLGYGSTVIENVTINVTGCDNYSPNPFNVYGDLTLGEGTVVNVDYLGTALISNNGAVNIVIDGAEINIGTFKRNGVMIDLNNATTFEMKDTTMKIDTYVLSQFGGEGLTNKIDGITIENCTFDITDSNGASCTFVADAGLGRYDLVQK